mmetsp:Transcript_61100/g.101621  ORF Transcript_61100/g.101621 Transcript_61100/m.101621 type:complete len:320 (+) Transcript_61100:3-962(+)
MRSTGKVLFTLEQQQITGLLQVLASNGSASSIQLLAAISGQFTAAKSVGSTGTQKTLSVAHLWHESHSRSCGEMATCSEMHTNKPRCWGQLRSSSGSSGQELAHCNGSGAHEKRLLPSPTSCNEQQGNAKTRRLARRAADRAATDSKAAVRIQAVVRRLIVFWRAIRYTVTHFPGNRGLNATQIWREEEAERLARQKVEAEQAAANRLVAAEKVLAASRTRRESDMLARAWRLQIFSVLDHRGQTRLTNCYVNNLTGERVNREPAQLRDIRRRDEMLRRLRKYEKGELSDDNVKRLCFDLLGPYGPSARELEAVLKTDS